jgi:hypothetical protein
MDATKTKPFNIDKKLVYDAYKAVKANAGAAGVVRATAIACVTVGASQPSYAQPAFLRRERPLRRRTASKGAMECPNLSPNSSSTCSSRLG